VRVVEVHVNVNILGDTFSAMRRWLDHNHCTPVKFDYISDDPIQTEGLRLTAQTEEVLTDKAVLAPLVRV